ncbi:MAG: DUF4431 domain-containing protein [Xanthobacteraceae bacterium]
MFKKPLIVAVVCALVGIGAHAGAPCLDVRQSQPLTFKGSLSRPVFPGPPNYEDVKKGDKPERAYIIKLDAPICATGDEFLDSSQTFDTVQLLVDDSANDSRALNASLTQLIGKRVEVTGKSGFGAQTGHHHAPLLVTLVKIAAEGTGR